jgi:hypothetical protein
LAQALDAHSRIVANAEGLHIQWCNAQTATERSAFRNMQDVFKHASMFVENKRKARQQTRKRTTDSSYSPYPGSPTTTKSTSIDEPVNLNSQSKGLNITPVVDSPRETNNNQVDLEDTLRDKGANGRRASGNRYSRVMGNADSDEKTVKNRSNNPLYKTRLCERFEAEGYCPYDTKCTFAHGTAELRERTVEHTEENVNGRAEFADNGLFKTKLCERYMKGNFCQYGPKCNFGKFQPAKHKTSKHAIDHGNLSILAHGMSELKRRSSKDKNGHTDMSHNEHLPHYKSSRVESGDRDMRSTEDIYLNESNQSEPVVPLNKPLSPVTPIAR